jgi:hypothetical protein
MPSYREDIAIDETALDLEWLGQPQLAYEYAQYQADARKVMDIAKENQMVIHAEVEQEVREDPDAFKLAKVTEKAIEAAILQDSRYRAASKKVINCQHEYSSSQAAVHAIEHRKQALENLVKLMGMNYFSSPKEARDLPVEVKERNERRRINKTIKLTRKKKKKE